MFLYRIQEHCESVGVTPLVAIWLFTAGVFLLGVLLLAALILSLEWNGTFITNWSATDCGGIYAIWSHIFFTVFSSANIEQHILEEGYMHKNQPIIVPGVNWPGLGVEVSIGSGLLSDTIA